MLCYVVQYVALTTGRSQFSFATTLQFDRLRVEDGVANQSWEQSWEQKLGTELGHTKAELEFVCTSSRALRALCAITSLPFSTLKEVTVEYEAPPERFCFCISKMHILHIKIEFAYLKYLQ